MRMKSWSPTRHRKQHKDGSGRCYLMELPTELLLEIVSHLTLVPEAALALTCKRMLAISGSILKSQSLRFGRDFAPLFHHYRNGHNFATPRWQFLNLLEDGRWHICSKCLKLHPRAAFTSRELRRKPEHRSCNLGDLAGIVDLCPCKKLTFRDKLDLIDHLSSYRYCWHSCLENYGPTQMKISIYPELDENDQLRVRTEYEMTTEAGQVGKEAYMTPRFGCAHRSVDLWLSSVHQTSVCRLFDSYCTSCRRISVCGACNTSSSARGNNHTTRANWAEIPFTSSRSATSAARNPFLTTNGRHNEFIQLNLPLAWRIAMSSVRGLFENIRP
ncbi:hypothetical protein POX_c04672 [Penicillium oxalicum]|uniref:hypothetical protein n=1 Tax=Penicillium oxalicum TaxID=69781 RepID=UPI0020B6CC53|nr:hypothetical protein POX_c04672 [Penicillium oxalicum]KAI2791793.1 hypothetical protein POX_c04672 [Penicillium oxalicum]